MKIEARYTVENGIRVPRCVILVCENEEESNLLDIAGNLFEQVTGELRLADGYGEFYLMLPACEVAKRKAIAEHESN